MNQYQSVLNSVAALGADCTYVSSTQTLNITGLGNINMTGLKASTVLAPVTEVLQVTTGTPAAANSTVYGIVLGYVNITTNFYETKIFLYTSDATATPTEVCDGFRNQINACSATIPVAATGTATLILTAVTGLSPALAQFAVTNIGPGVIAFVTGTAAVCRVGYGGDLNSGATANADFINTDYYYQVIMDHTTSQYGTEAMSNSNVVSRSILYVQNSVTNYLTLIGSYGTVTQGLKHVSATWTAGTGTLAYTSSSGAIELASGGTWPDQNILPGDVLVFLVADTTYYPVQVETDSNSGLSATALHADVAAATYFYIQLRKVV